LGMTAFGIYVSLPQSASTASALHLFSERKAKQIPVMQFQDGAGKPRTLADFRGKLVLLNIWATWCAPCREEMPALDRLQAQLGGSNFEVVALSIDQQGPEEVRKFYDEIGVKALQLYIDPSAQASSRLGILGVPSTLLVDPGGLEIGRKMGPAKWDSPQSINELRQRMIRGGKVE